MSESLLYAFLIFAAVMAFTPGPNNIMLLSSGLTYGFRRTLPLLAGILLGGTFMIAAVGLGLGAVFSAYPVLKTILKYAGAAYLVYLAVVIAISDTTSTGQGATRGPISFWSAVLLQWVNVKAWVMIIGTITVYAAIAAYPLNIAIQTGICFLIGILATTTWALFGHALRPFLTSPAKVRAFNIVMALLLLCSLYPVFTDA